MMITALENKTLVPVQLEGEFHALFSKTFSSEPGWLKEKRKEAFDSFCNTGIPSPRNEEYKYTDVRKIFNRNFTAIHNEAHKISVTSLPSPMGEGLGVRLIFVNGWLYKDSTLSVTLPKGVIVGSMAADALFLNREILEKYIGTIADKSKDIFAQLNTAFWFDGAFIYIPEKIILEKPIEIIHLCTGADELLVNPRHLIIAEKSSQAQIIEHSISLNAEKKIIVNSVAEVFAAENARVNYYKIQNSNKNVFHLHSTHAVQKQQSVFDTCTVTLGSEWVRNNLNISLSAENCETHLHGLFLTNGTQHVDNHTLVDHRKPNCRSNQLYKGILDGKSTGIFNGKIFVERDAQKTNAYQSSKNILLSDDAAVNTKPQLEIYADDVKCSHGSSTGKIDEDALFYLRSRGLSKDSAKNLLLFAFAGDVIKKIEIAPMKIYLEELVNKSLSVRTSSEEK